MLSNITGESLEMYRDVCPPPAGLQRGGVSL